MTDPAAKVAHRRAATVIHVRRVAMIVVPLARVGMTDAHRVPPDPTIARHSTATAVDRRIVPPTIATRVVPLARVDLVPRAKVTRARRSTATAVVVRAEARAARAPLAQQVHRIVRSTAMVVMAVVAPAAPADLAHRVTVVPVACAPVQVHVRLVAAPLRRVRPNRKQKREHGVRATVAATRKRIATVLSAISSTRASAPT